jgi:hypothetical protein
MPSEGSLEALKRHWEGRSAITAPDDDWKTEAERLLRETDTLAQPALEIWPDGGPEFRRQIMRLAGTTVSADKRHRATVGFAVLRNAKQPRLACSIIAKAMQRYLVGRTSTIACAPGVLRGATLAALSPMTLRQIADDAANKRPRWAAISKDLFANGCPGFCVAPLIRRGPTPTSVGDYFDHLDEYDFVGSHHGAHQPSATRALDASANTIAGSLLVSGEVDAIWPPADHARTLDTLARETFVANVLAARKSLPSGICHVHETGDRAFAIVADNKTALGLIQTEAGWLYEEARRLLSDLKTEGDIVVHESADMLALAALPIRGRPQ